jgi:hypothetical protein
MKGREQILAKMYRLKKLDAVRTPSRDYSTIHNNGKEDRVMEQRPAPLSSYDGEA